MTDERAGSVFSSAEAERLVLWLGHRLDDIEQNRLDRVRMDLAVGWPKERVHMPAPLREDMANEIARARVALTEHPPELEAAAAALRQAIRVLTAL